jgi:DNA-binding transcriptional LysR family regulator
MNLRRLDLNLLVVFEAVVSEASVSRAASRLNLTQPALSHALARLREAFGDPVLVREGRAMRPTSRALAALPEVREVLGQAARLFAQGGRFDPASVARTVHVGASDYAARRVMPALLKETRRHAPALRFVMQHAGRVDAPGLLRSGALDLAIGVFGALTPDLDTCPLIEEPYVCVRWKGAAGRLNAATYLDAAHLNVLVAGETLGLIDEALALRGQARRIAVTVAHFGVALDLLPGSDLVLTAPAGLVAGLPTHLDLTCAKPPVSLPPFRTQLAWARRRADDEGLTWLRERIVAVSRRPAPRGGVAKRTARPL